MTLFGCWCVTVCNPRDIGVLQHAHEIVLPQHSVVGGVRRNRIVGGHFPTLRLLSSASQ